MPRGPHRARQGRILTGRVPDCALACTHLALPPATVARALCIALQAVLQAVPRGHALLARHAEEIQAIRHILRGSGATPGRRAIRGPWEFR